ncbi:MAG: hypothetical protein KDI17_13110 [Halioglobus sp.]|nr:hypothetical protein [Halioglobus sp.]
MTARRLVGILGAAIWGTFGMMPAQASAAGGDPAPQDIRLGSAGALVDICTVEPTHDDYAASLGFCYGFFEGAVRYHQAVSGAGVNRHLVCAPEDTTRQQGVEVFIDYIQENPQYASEASVDAVFRALGARWPCKD